MAECHPDQRHYSHGQCRSCATRLRNRRLKLKLLELRGGKCVDCGYDAHPAALDFDHRDPSTKLLEVSQMSSEAGWDRLVAEAEKCDIRCANCHRIKTFEAREGGHWG